MSSISSLSAGAGLFGIDVSGIQANAEAALAAAQARKSAATAVTTPWSTAGARLAPSAENMVRSALAGRSAIESSSTLTSTRSHDAQSLFKLYNGLQALSALAEKASLKTTSDFDRTQLNAAFAKQFAEAQTYVDKVELDKVTVVKGSKLSKEDSALVLARSSQQYATGIVHSGAFGDPVAALSGNVTFSVTVARSTGTNVVNIDLSEMGATPRSMSNIADYINSKLEAAGANARFSAVRAGTPNAAGRIEADTFGFKITTSLYEKISFSASSSAPALVVAGRSGAGATGDARLTKFTGIGTAPAEEFVNTLNPDKGAVTWKSVAVGADGAYYAVGETTASLDGTALKSDRDAIVAKYDSAGKLLWTKSLGAADEAGAYSVAVSADGNVAVAGATKGRLSADIKGGLDSFVTLLDSSGDEQWTKQTGTSSEDKALAVAFDATGNIVVAGTTKGMLVSGQQQGGADGYIEAFDAAGAQISRQQFGTAGADLIGGIAVAADGQVIVASTESGRGVLRKFDVSASATGTPSWTQDLGDLGVGGNVSSVGYDSGAIYVGGRATSSGLDAAQGGAAFSGGVQDGFLARFDDGVAPSRAWGTFIGSSGDDQVRSIAVYGGKVYATGETSGALSGAVKVGTQDMFIAQINAAAGGLEAATQISGGAGYAMGAAIAVDPQGDSVLDLLGLPRGQLNTPRSTELTARSSVRAGDSFYVSVDGGAKRKITIESGDDWTDLSFKINSAIGFGGRAAVRTTSTGTSLRVEAKGTSRIEFAKGPEGRDALEALGLKVGTVFNDPALAGTTSSSAPPVVALGLDPTWVLDSIADSATARDKLVDVMRRVRNAYDLATTTKSSTKTPGKSGGSVPAYMTAQLQNYSAALARLQNGG